MLYPQKTGRIFMKPFNYRAEEDFYSLNLSKQITLGYALMLFLIVLMSGFSIYNIYKLDKSSSNIEGRYKY